MSVSEKLANNCAYYAAVYDSYVISLGPPRQMGEERKCGIIQS